MSARASDESASTLEEIGNRHSRRNAAKISSYADDDDVIMEEDDEESDVDPSSSSDGDDDDDDEEMDSKPRARRRNRSRAAKRRSNRMVDSSDDEPVLGRRTSSRSTKFASSMKEPTVESISALMQIAETPPAKKKKKRATKRAASRDSDDDDDSMSDEEFETPPAKKKAPKSPAVSHSSERRRVETKVQMTDDSEEELDFSDESEAETEEGGDLKIQRIIAAVSKTRRDWKKICDPINTSELDYGSRWFQSAAADGAQLGDDTFEERFLVKWADLSFLHCSWETQADLCAQVENAKKYLSTFFRKSENGLLYTADERCDGDYFDPGYVQVDRILEVFVPPHLEDRQIDKTEGMSAVEQFGIVMNKADLGFEEGTGRQFAIKWASSPYTAVSFEFERDLIINEVEYEELLKAYHKRTPKPSKSEMKQLLKAGEEETRRLYKLLGDKSKMDDDEKAEKVGEYQKQLEDHVFPNGGQLRDYQAEGVSWLLSNYINKRSSLLADEMGLGKTLQTAAFIDLIATKLHRRGPFLIVAPLSTLAHWQREFAAWTDLNTFVYHGSQNDREFIREYEMAYECDRPNSVAFNSSFLKKCAKNFRTKFDRIWMAQVVITSPEMLVTDDFVELTNIDWEVLVVDEAQKLKSHTSKLATNLRDRRFTFKHTLLLTGTPIQNNTTELWSLLNFIEPDEFEDLDEFLEEYGDLKSKEKVDDLHETMRPYILRRLKEDVEKSVPPKEETLIEVELTTLQKQYYRALYEKNVTFLLRNKKKALDGPSLNNLAMQLRKCCNHPFLLRGVEEELREQESEVAKSQMTQSEASQWEGDFLAKASGKLVLLDKLLPRLKADGHRVLLFSQFKIMLDILEDYLHAREWKIERIDGSITGKKRQMAIDRFQTPATEGKEAPFVMLLSTRAGGVGINLTAADTCIIFDSDWNPQNDLQAQARCHRIGQTKDVKVYRLLSRKTYEMQMFHMSSMKMGLDQAVLQGFENSSGEGAMTKEEVENLLRHGAYDIFTEEKAGSSEAASNDFIQQDIDSILERRSKTVIHENTGSKSSAAGGTFSKASFKAPKTPNQNKSPDKGEDVDVMDPDFWKKMVGEGHVQDDSMNLAGKKRNRKAANYNEKAYEKNLNDTLLLSDTGGSSSDGDSSSDDDRYDLAEGTPDDETGAPKKKKERARWGRKDKESTTEWTKVDFTNVLKGIQTYGYGHMPWNEFCSRVGVNISKYSEDEVKRMCWSLVLLTLREAADDDVVASKRRAERAAAKKKEAENKDKPAVEGGILGDANAAAVATVNPADNFEACFQKLRKTHQAWIGQAIRHAQEFGASHQPRRKQVLDRALKSREARKPTEAMKSMSALFAENVWPALRSRGWKSDVSATEKGEVTRYVHGVEQFKSIRAVLDAVPKIHPELSSTIAVVASSVEAAPKTPDTNVLSAVRLDQANLTASSLTAFLNHFAPLQLLADRKRAKKAFLSKKSLATCSFLHVAHSFMNRASAVSGDADSIQRLSSLISLDKRTALPHPAWKLNHDAVLILAIAKHGWIEHDSCCRDITGDASIKWGTPFEDTGTSTDAPTASKKQMVESDLEVLCRTAKRVAAFFNLEEQEIVDGMKGFKKSLLATSFGLLRETAQEKDSAVETTEGSAQGSASWNADESLIRKASGLAYSDGDSKDARDTDLPSKKDLLRRAKSVLAKPPASTEQARPAAGKSEEKHAAQPHVEHNYAVLDQTDPANSFLAELMRTLVKVSFQNTSKRKNLGRRLCGYIAEEAACRKEDLEVLAAKKGTEESRVAAEDMTKIIEHIHVVNRFIQPQSIPAKNVIRVIIGQAPILPKSANEKLFPTDQLLSSLHIVPTEQKGKHGESRAKPEPSKPPPKLKKPKEGGAIGDSSIQVAMSRALNIDYSVTPSPPEDELWLNGLETLLFTVLGSQGIPVWGATWRTTLSENDVVEPTQGHQCRIWWDGIGRVLFAAAELWHDRAVKKLATRQASFDKKYSAVPNSSPQKQQQVAKLDLLRADVDDKHEALELARGLKTTPERLAKKCVLLIHALTSRMGTTELSKHGRKKSVKSLNNSEYGLAPFVLTWMRDEATKWSKSLNIIDEKGSPHKFTAVDYPVAEGKDIFQPMAVLTKKECRSVFTQIAQQCRCRSMFMEYDAVQIKDWIRTGTNNMERTGDRWDWQPSWWCGPRESPSTVENDYRLLTMLLDTGWGGLQEPLATLLPPGEENVAKVLSNASVQVRVHQLVRELHATEESSKAIMAGYKSHAVNGSSKSGTSQQPDIAAFFSPRPKPAAPEVVEIAEDDDEVQGSASTPSKRKELDGAETNASPEKKAKS